MDVSGIAGANDTDPKLRRPRYEPNDMLWEISNVYRVKKSQRVLRDFVRDL